LQAFGGRNRHLNRHPRQKAAGYGQKAAGYEQKAAGFGQKAPGYDCKPGVYERFVKVFIPKGVNLKNFA
jgi:hypothetical protein